MKSSNVLLWLDDERDPMQRIPGEFCTWAEKYSPVPVTEIDEVIWVKSYKEFVDYINQPIPLPRAICFDHDLGTKETGMDCAKYLVEMCMNMKLTLPKYNIQSANPAGKANICSLLSGYNKFFNF